MSAIPDLKKVAADMVAEDFGLKSAVGSIYHIPRPFHLFLGDTLDAKAIKTATGLAKWCRDDVVGEYSMLDAYPSSGVDVPFMNYEQAVANGAKTLVIGLAPGGGQLPTMWVPELRKAMDAGLNIASGLHERISNKALLATCARRNGVQLFDFRYHPELYPLATGARRSGRRLLTVGHDSNCGKKYTTLSLKRLLDNTLDLPFSHSFRSTGQTGFLISNSGINLDTIPADYMAGACEWLTPEAPNNHWDLVEGQGSLFHPAYAGGSAALLMGTQPDLMIMCVDVSRTRYRNTDMILGSLAEEMQVCTQFARRTNPEAGIFAISLQVPSDESWGMYHEHFQGMFPTLDIINPNIPETMQPIVAKMCRITDKKC